MEAPYYTHNSTRNINFILQRKRQSIDFGFVLKLLLMVVVKLYLLNYQGVSFHQMYEHYLLSL